LLPWHLCLVLGRLAAAAAQIHCQQPPWLHPEGCQRPRPLLLLLLVVWLPLMLAGLLLLQWSPTCSCETNARQRQVRHHHHHLLLLVPRLETGLAAAAQPATQAPGECPAQEA
jgi:hypothetical protein